MECSVLGFVFPMRSSPLRGSRKCTNVRGSFRALPPSTRSPEEEFDDFSRKLEFKEQELASEPREYVIVSHKDKRLLAEVIDHVEARDMHWLRPCLIVENASETTEIRDFKGLESESSESNIYDLRGTSDVFLPDNFASKADPTMNLVLRMLMTSHDVDFSDVADAERVRAGKALMEMLKQISTDSPDRFRT
ncbi:hypothetical protein NDN08_000660 [Rhodosorus marinus]|uniref:Uncharacterized protein n=1 Tax=Rhodosorus marinus TaxID=101924 RepID=A0AAV8USU8_9RHOD|nr:hypothetical protein NDN08_000660 [Rhodosorus marinus]